VTFIGVAQSFDTLETPLPNTDPPIYQQPIGFNFKVVVEAKRGPSGRPAGQNAFRYDPSDPTVRPDLEIIVSQPLGNGSTKVCDDGSDGMPIGGVPASTGFDLLQPISDAINDFACRFTNGSGNPGAVGLGDQCTIGRDGLPVFANSSSMVQFCAQIAEKFEFPLGDTLVTARVHDSTGTPGDPASMIVRVLGP
jgi:hypothetical protein